MSSALAALALVIAAVALFVARRASRQAAQLTELYWQLKYDHGELKATIAPGEPPPPPAPKTSFVPLGSIKRSND
ncbi:MAG: hypothetical protein IT178_08935 [Acidobacteria bacterium]|nr:hypothetical protein [Acidobacteriota bacterium]